MSSLGCKLDAARRSQPSVPGIDFSQQLIRKFRFATPECTFDLLQPGAEFLLYPCPTFREFVRMTLARAEQ